uniref:Hexosyltransferase n=1 Tax=Clytia hemisphaerica TaxID=252671 RepID=A0A7M5V035_9CNID
FQIIYTDSFVLKHKDRIYAGLIYPKTLPNRHRRSKWYISKKEYAPNTSPPFATGLGFILTRLIVERIRPHFDWVNPFRMDDVYVGMLINRANITGLGIRYAKGERQFSGFNLPNQCKYQKDAVVYHKVSSHSCMKN